VRTLHQGELFAIDKRSPLDVQVAAAIKRFVTKHKCEPHDIRWNPDSYQDKHSKLTLAVDKSIPPLHMWLEMADKGDA